MVLKLLSRHGFQIQGDSDIDLLPTDPKNSTILLLNKSNHPMKFDNSGQMVLELLIGQGLVYGKNERPTSAKRGIIMTGHRFLQCDISA